MKPEDAERLRHIMAAVAQWGEAVEPDQARTQAPKRLPYNAAYRRIRDFAESLIGEPVLMRVMSTPIGADFGRPDLDLIAVADADRPCRVSSTRLYRSPCWCQDLRKSFRTSRN